jgi:hypothetical protein
MFDKYRKHRRSARGDERLRRKIAVEAARRLWPLVGPTEPDGPLHEASEADYYAAKRRAAAVLGQTVRPGDLPSDSEVRQKVLEMARTREGPGPDEGPEPEEEARRIADHIDRFALYKMRLTPLETVKQDARRHPEGDALYHSLQVFEQARQVRPYDEEFLLAALLHDVGKGIDPRDHVRAGLASLRGAIPERTGWLIEHHGLSFAYRDKTLSPKLRRLLESSEYLDDLLLLRELDEAGRAVGVPVSTVDEALAYLKGLEDESYLDEAGAPEGGDHP